MDHGDGCKRGAVAGVAGDGGGAASADLGSEDDDHDSMDGEREGASGMPRGLEGCGMGGAHSVAAGGGTASCDSSSGGMDYSDDDNCGIADVAGVAGSAAGAGLGSDGDDHDGRDGEFNASVGLQAGLAAARSVTEVGSQTWLSTRTHAMWKVGGILGGSMGGIGGMGMGGMGSMMGGIGTGTGCGVASHIVIGGIPDAFGCWAALAWTRGLMAWAAKAMTSERT